MIKGLMSYAFLILWVIGSVPAHSFANSKLDREGAPMPDSKQDQNDFIYAQQASTSPLVGTWILAKSENPLPDGSVVSYCTGVHGFIIYTEEGYVSVALNCDPQGNGAEPADISGRKFFYTGTYHFDGATVTHTMLNASQPELIGKSFARQVTIQDSTLILTGVNQGQAFSAYWKRLKSVPK